MYVQLFHLKFGRYGKNSYLCTVDYPSMAKFFLRTQKQEGTATLYITIQKRVPKVSLRFVSTGIEVDIQTWNRVNRNIQSWSRYTATKEGEELQRKMSLVIQTIDSLFNEGLIGGNEDKDVIEDALRDISTVEAHRMKSELQQIRKAEEERRRQSIVHFYEYFMEGITNGTIRHGDGKRYKEGTIYGWKTFGVLLHEYCPDGATFNDITKAFADGFHRFLEDKGFMLLTVNNNICHFKRLCNLAAEEGINSNAVSLKVWKKRTAKAEDKRAEIYLTDVELDALYNMKLDSHQSAIRDVFFIGYLSGQRFSDYSDYSIDNFKKTEKGIDVIGLIQKKTGNYVEVPIWDVRLTEIARKYAYVFPKLTNLQLNHGIRDIMKALSESVPSLREKFTTALSLPERKAELLYQRLCDKKASGAKWEDLSEKRAYFRLKKYATEHNGKPLWERNSIGQVVRPKYELVSSHTARRSSITNLYKTGLLSYKEMMSISGHKDEKVFEEYIKVGVTEQAERVGEKLIKAKEIPMKKAE